MNEVFLDYSKYYDLLNQDKDYKSEAQFIISKIRDFFPHAKTILNIGCGTGLHDPYFAEEGFELTGIDFSGQMLSIAKEKNSRLGCKYIQGDACNLNLDQKFDAVISIFHVLSYQTSNQKVEEYFRGIKRHLNKNGIAIFDYWYGPAVLNIRPNKRTREAESHDLKILRHASTRLDFVKNVATVNF